MEYRITYEIEVDADSPEEAAMIVADILYENSYKSVYRVDTETSSQLIDLLKLEELDNVN